MNDGQWSLLVAVTGHGPSLDASRTGWCRGTSGASPGEPPRLVRRPQGGADGRRRPQIPSRCRGGRAALPRFGGCRVVTLPNRSRPGPWPGCGRARGRTCRPSSTWRLRARAGGGAAGGGRGTRFGGVGRRASAARVARSGAGCRVRTSVSVRRVARTMTRPVGGTAGCRTRVRGCGCPRHSSARGGSRAGRPWSGWSSSWRSRWRSSGSGWRGPGPPTAAPSSRPEVGREPGRPG